MRKCAVVLLVLGASLGVMAPASARTTSSAHATLSTRGGHVAPHACRHSSIGYRLVLDDAGIPDLRAWSANVTVTGPHHYRDTAFLYEPTDGTGWQRTWFCGSPNRAGTYRVTAKVDITHDTSYIGSHTYETLSTTFAVTTRR